jgi:tetratricopeptide (TPR) repeat protein
VEQSFKIHPLLVEPSNIVLHHYGKVLDPEHLEEKKKLYLELGRKKADEESDSAMAHYEIGVQLYEVQQFEESIPHFLKAYQLHKKADICLLYAAKAYHVLGKMAEAEKYYQQCVDLAPGERVLFEYANFERDLGHLKTAISLYQKSLAIDPNYALSLFNLGCVYIRMGQTQKGFGFLKKALKLDPSNETFHENFGRLAMAGGPWEEATRCLEEFMQRFPKSLRCPATLTQLYFKQNRFPQTIEWADRALENNPRNYSVLLTKAHSLMCLRHLEAAEEAYQEVLKFDATNLDALMNLAAIAELSGQMAQSLDYYKMLLIYHPDQPLALKKIGKALAAQGLNTEEALDYLERTCRVNPDDTECILLLGSLYEKVNRHQDAINLFEQARQTNPKLERLAQGKIRHWENMMAANASQLLEGSIPLITK